MLAMAGDRDITPEQADSLRREQDAQLIDVREDHEWEAGRIDGARHIVLGEVASQASSIDQDRPIVFYCRVGSRSAMAADAFRSAGYDAYSLGGGLHAWAGHGLPLDPPGGAVADH